MFLDIRSVLINPTDLHCGNIFLRLPANVRQMIDPSQLYQKFGDPMLDPIVRVDRKSLTAGVPTHIVGPARLGIPSDQITPAYLPIMLSEFGSSYHPSKTRRTIAYTLPRLAPPQTLFSTSKLKTPFPTPAISGLLGVPYLKSSVAEAHLVSWAEA